MMKNEGDKLRPVALIGGEVSYSLSPVMHNAAFSILGLPFFYCHLSLGEEDLPKFMEAFHKLDFAGGNVTWPFKEKVIPFVDELSPTARECYSVNTLSKEGSKIVGDCTDGEGFLHSCRWHGINLEGSRVLLIGAGGAARAVGYAAASAGAAVIILANRTPARAESLRLALSDRYHDLDIQVISLGEMTSEVPLSADLIINATSVGMKDDDPLLVPAESFRPGQVLYELIYAPLETKMMREAGSSGAKVFNGLAMLLFQGAASFRIWTGQKAPLTVMADALCREVGLESWEMSGEM